MDYALDYYMRKTKTGKIRLKSGDKAERTMRITLLSLTMLTFVSFIFFDLTGFELKTAFVETMYNLKSMFLMPALSHFTFMEGLFQVIQTLGLAVLSTIIGAVIAFFLALFAATNISKPSVSKVIRVMVAFIRAVPTVLWVLIFAISAGLGSEAAVLGMMFHSIAYLVKAYSEAIEEIDAGIIESLRASGANYWHIVKHGILPSTSTYLLSWTFLRFEINFGVAVAMGAAAGAGGIGFELFMASGFYYDLREVGFITYMILLIAILLEMYSSKLKGKYLQASS